MINYIGNQNVKNNNGSLKKILFFVPLILLFLVDFFSLNEGVFGYLDEVLALIYALYCGLKIALIKNSVKYIKVIMLFLTMIIIGVIGNIFNNDVMLNMKYILIDIFMFIKPYIFLMASILFAKTNNYDFQLKKIGFFSKLMIFLIFIFGIFHIVLNGFDFYYIWNKNRYSFTTSFCGTLASYIIIFETLILLSNEKNKFFWSFLAFISIIITTSGVGILSLFLFIIFFFIFPKYKLKWYHLGFVGILAIIIGWNEISGYLLDSSTARSLMYINGFKCAMNYFPFGAGFANYGGYGAAYNYSKLYYKFGYDTIWGLQPLTYGGPNFLFDTYYPMIIGQFGFIGTCIFIGFIAKNFVLLFKKKDYLTFSLLLMFMITGLGFNFSSPAICLQFFVAGLSYVSFDKRKIIVLND